MKIKSKKLISNLVAGSIIINSTPAQAMESNIDLANEGVTISKENMVENEANLNEPEDTTHALVKNEDATIESSNPTLENKSDKDNIQSKSNIDKYDNISNMGIAEKADEKVLEISLADGEYVPDLTDKVGVYETIKVTTTGDKKLESRDYDNLRLSKIPKVDLSNAYSDSIPGGAFSGAAHLTEFKFPKGVISIEDGGYNSSLGSNYGAFYKCTGLVGELVIPDSVVNIGDYAFGWCGGLSGNLIIPDSVTNIGKSAFRACTGLNGNLVLSESLVTVGESAFYDCMGLKGNLVIPESVTNIYSYAFYNCVGFTGDLIIPSSITRVGMYTFENCTGFNGRLVIPNSVEVIDRRAFYNCYNLSGNLKLPESVIRINMSAFENCSSLTGDLIIPDSVTNIGSYAFDSCRGFNGRLVIGSSVESIGQDAFNSCSGLTGDLIIPNSVTKIGNDAFYYCSGLDGNLVIGSSVESIGDKAFRNCRKLNGSVVIPNSVTTIGNDVFALCNSVGKIIIQINENHTDINYRKAIIDKLPVDKTYIEMSYNFDDSEITWLETTGFTKAKPVISAYAGKFENNEGIGVTLDIIEASDIKTMTIMKDGESYTLEKSENGKYVFSENGDYEVYIETELGTMSNIEFKNISPILQPNIEYKDGNINVIDNGCLSSEVSEEFDDPNNLVFDFSNSNWDIENGVLKSEKINNSSSTENELKINAEVGDKLQISIKTSSESGYDWGYVYLNGAKVYEKSGIKGVGFEVLDFDLQEGENVIKFEYTKDSSGSRGDDAIFIDCIKILKNKTIKVDCDTLEYRINGGEWQTYTDSFELNYPVGTKILVEARAKHDGFESTIFSQDVIVEVSTKDVEDAVEKAEQSKEPADIEDARDLVSKLPSGAIKEELTNRLDALEELIAKENAAIQAVEKAEQSKDINDIEDARDLVSKLPSGAIKEELTNRLDALEELIAKENAAIQAVEKAEQSKDINDIEDARDLVSKLPSGPIKEELTNRLDALEELIAKENAAIQAVEKAEQSKKPADIDEARDLVNQLPDGAIKEELTNRLDKLEEDIAKPDINDNTDSEGPNSNKNDNKDNPKTGDNLMVPVGGLITSIIGIVTLNRRNKK